jgi:hypothetical protein
MRECSVTDVNLLVAEVLEKDTPLIQRCAACEQELGVVHQSVDNNITHGCCRRNFIETLLDSGFDASEAEQEAVKLENDHQFTWTPDLKGKNANV